MLIKYAFKSGRVMAQFGIAGVLAVAGVGLLFSTVSRWRYESALRDAIYGSNTGQGEVRALLDDAAKMRPDDPFPMMLRGQYYLDRGQLNLGSADESDPQKALSSAQPPLKQAIKDFDEAIRLCKDLPTASETDQALAAAGAAAARLALADADPAQRAALIDQAGKALEQAPGVDEPDLLGVRAGYAIARGDLAAATKALTEMSGKLGQASRLAVSAYSWNRGMLELLARDPDCVAELERACILRRCTGAAHLVGLAVRVAAADPAVPVKSPEALAARLGELKRVFGYHVRMKGGSATSTSRYGLEPAEESLTWNAIGIGYTRVPDADKAIEAFQTAINMNRKDWTTVLNRSLAFKLKSEHLAPDEKDPRMAERRLLESFAGGIEDAGRVLGEKGGNDDLAQRLFLSGAVIRWQIFQAPNETSLPINSAKAKAHLSDADWNRWLGVLGDWWGLLGDSVPYYKRAIDLHHRDSGKMMQRVEKFEREMRGKGR